MSYSNRIDTIVLDLDGTCWDWLAFACEAYPAMARAIATETNRSIDHIMKGMKECYTVAETMEYPYLVNALIASGHIEVGEEEARHQLITKIRGVYRQALDSLVIQPGMNELLEANKSAGGRNIILTDAIAFQAAQRVRESGLNQGVIESMHALKGPLIESVPTEDLIKFEKEGYKLDFPVYTLETTKPNHDLSRILDLIKYEIKRGVAIYGDSLPADMKLADQWGCVGFHAQHFSMPKNIGDLLPMVPDRFLAKKSANDDGQSIPIFHPSAVLPYIIVKPA